MFLKIGKSVTKGKEDYWKIIFDLMMFFDIKESINEKHAENFNIIIANYGVIPTEIAIKPVGKNVIYGVKNNKVEVYFILKNKILIPLWKN